MLFSQNIFKTKFRDQLVSLAPQGMKSVDQVLTRDAIYLAMFYNKLFTNRSFFLYKFLEVLSLE